MGVGQLVPNTKRGQKRLELGATPSFMLYPLIFDFNKWIAIV